MSTPESDPPPPGWITERLAAWREGDREAFDEVITRLEPELRKLARRRFRERPDHVLQPTAVVNEVWLRLVGQTKMTFENRAHFLGACARTMYRLLVDDARRRDAQKRGGPDRVRVPADDLLGAGIDVDVLALHEVLERVRKVNPRQHEVFIHSFLTEMTRQEIAEELGVSVATVRDDKRFVKAWVKKELTAPEKAKG